MSNYKLVPLEPTPEMVEAAEEACMPFRDMDLAIRMAILGAPDVEGEPVATLNDHKCFDLEDVNRIMRLPAGTKLYAAPQPAEQKPAPDVSALVEALEPFAKCARELDGSPEDGIDPADDDEWAKFRLLVSDYRRARAALAAHRKQGGES